MEHHNHIDHLSNPGRKSGAGAVFFQPKLSINQPNDSFEQEADAMADKVMRVTDTRANHDPFFKPAYSKPVNNAAQRKCQACEEEEQHVHRKEINGGETDSPAGLDSYVGSLHSSGQPLPDSSRNFFERSFGHDFSGVRVHNDGAAAKSAQSINALAYTSGNNIVFNTGQYAPESDTGKRLMAHELTHVVQQGGTSEKVQRMGDLSQRPSVLSCPVPASTAPSSVLTSLFPLSSSTLTAAQKTNIATFVTSWRASGGTDRLRVDGYASEPGTDSYNWTLSCNRAMAVADELRADGVPTNLMEVYANGETREFGAQANNQATHISMTSTPTAPQAPTQPTPPPAPTQPAPTPTQPAPAPTPTQPTPPQPAPATPAPASCPVTCAVPIVLYSDTTNCGSGDDFLNHDRPGGPRGTAASLAVMTHYGSLTDLELLNNMLYGLDGLVLLGGAPGRAAAMNFYGGTGTAMDHNASSPIGAAANTSASFTRTAGSVETAFHTIMTGMATTPASNTCSAYSLTASAVPRVNFPLPLDPTDAAFSQNLMLKAVIGGTHGIEITLTALTIDCAAHTYQATVHYRICDNFGVDDTSDLYSDSLISFWVLQHMRSGHAAFINNILLDRSISGSF